MIVATRQVASNRAAFVLQQHDTILSREPARLVGAAADGVNGHAARRCGDERGTMSEPKPTPSCFAGTWMACNLQPPLY